MNYSITLSPHLTISFPPIPMLHTGVDLVEITYILQLD